MKVQVIITLKKNVLDPQGKVIQQTLDDMGFNNIREVRQGKFFEIEIDEKDQKKAKEKVKEAVKPAVASLKDKVKYPCSAAPTASPSSDAAGQKNASSTSSKASIF